MRGKLLNQLFADSALELLLVMAQHTGQVSCYVRPSDVKALLPPSVGTQQMSGCL